MRTLILSLLMLSNTNFSTMLNSSVTHVESKVEPFSMFYYTYVTKVNNRTTVNNDHKPSHIKFVNPKRAIGKRESNGNWTIVNSEGYIGLYQFGRSALDATGYNHISLQEFTKNPSIWPPEEQEKAMSRLLKLNRSILSKYIEQFQGDTINGIVITESGLLAAAHLAGAGGVIRYLKSDGRYDPSDKNGTHLSTYLEEFAN